MTGFETVTYDLADDPDGNAEYPVMFVIRSATCTTTVRMTYEEAQTLSSQLAAMGPCRFKEVECEHVWLKDSPGARTKICTLCGEVRER